MNVLTGRCLCGAVRYETGSPVETAGYCHCDDCRRATGAHVVAWTTVRRDAFRFTHGRPHEFASSPGVIRTFCQGCGTALTYQNVEEPETLDLTIASLEQPQLVAAPAHHIWMQSAIAWDRPCDGLPMYRRTRADGERIEAD